VVVNEDVLEALTAECSGDRPHTGKPSWSPVWNVWLCFNCRAHRTDNELRIPLADGKKPSQGPGPLLRI
jgi:hypothetical protein